MLPIYSQLRCDLSYLQWYSLKTTELLDYLTNYFKMYLII